LELPPLLIDFAAPTPLCREPDRPSALRIIGNGPPGTFVLFPHGLRVSLPTDQIVFADDVEGYARVGFGGMQFVGLEDSRVVFVRVSPCRRSTEQGLSELCAGGDQVLAVIQHGQKLTTAQVFEKGVTH
jgi:hypothetical protein